MFDRTNLLDKLDSSRPESGIGTAEGRECAKDLIGERSGLHISNDLY